MAGGIKGGTRMKIEDFSCGCNFYFEDGTQISTRKDGTIRGGCYSYKHRCCFGGRPLTKELAKAQYDSIPIDEYVLIPVVRIPFTNCSIPKGNQNG